MEELESDLNQHNDPSAVLIHRSIPLCEWTTGFCAAVRSQMVHISMEK